MKMNKKLLEGIEQVGKATEMLINAIGSFVKSIANGKPIKYIFTDNINSDTIGYITTISADEIGNVFVTTDDNTNYLISELDTNTAETIASYLNCGLFQIENIEQYS